MKDNTLMPFTNPFRYSPSPEVIEAAGKIMSHIDGSDKLKKVFGEGKMLGVLVARSKEDGSISSLAAFSGNVGGENFIEGFVPPIFDLLNPDGHFKRTEALISNINKEIASIENSEEYLNAEKSVEDTILAWESKTADYKLFMAREKQKRKLIRNTAEDEKTIEAAIKESQFQKAELKRLRARAASETDSVNNHFKQIKQKVGQLKDKRQKMSDDLQNWIFRNFIVSNALGEEKSISDIFAEKGLVPPAGTGECAAPKLLHYAYKHNLQPVAMGEFWYCDEKAGEDRTGNDRNKNIIRLYNRKEQKIRGRFYPSCKSKCGPLLGYMLQGLEIGDIFTSKTGQPEILWEDSDIAVVSKPAGMLCVPGRTGGESMQEWLDRHYSETSGCTSEVYSVHRLDMDTSGVMLFAKTKQAQKSLHKQFAAREIQKTYIAILENRKGFEYGESGTIDLPVAADYDNRPAQTVDFQNGSDAVTDYRIIGFSDSAEVEDCNCCRHDDGKFSIVEFHPVTGRTHQLRVHSAIGLGCPIAGDKIYGGGISSERLCLHAESIRFKHPESGQTMEFKKKACFKTDGYPNTDVTKR